MSCVGVRRERCLKGVRLVGAWKAGWGLDLWRGGSGEGKEQLLGVGMGEGWPKGGALGGSSVVSGVGPSPL